MHRNSLIAAAIFGGLAVILGAFGAHGLEKVTTDEKILHAFQTAVQYQFYHALALLAVGIVYEKMPSRQMKLAAFFFTVGILTFCGSLYMLTLIKVNGWSGAGVFGPETPIGGLGFILGWFFFLLGVIKRKPGN